MITHFLGREEVAAYCRDFASRLGSLGANMPQVWCPIGKSGQVITEIIFAEIARSQPQVLPNVKILPISYQKPTADADGIASVIPHDDQSDEEIIESLKAALAQAPNALVIDSSIHSGASMLGVLKLLRGYGAKGIQSYALVIKKNAAFIPHYFGVVVGEHDRALFLLDEIPNNRLAKPGQTFSGVLRQLCKDDVNSSDELDTGVSSISKISWGDLLYDVRAHGFQVYVAEVDGRLAGFVKYKIDQMRHMKLDVVAVDQSFQKNGIGAALFRWVETAARANSCPSIDLWGIEGQVQKYGETGYKKAGDWLDTGGGEKYLPMSKPLLYHFDLRRLQS